VAAVVTGDEVEGGACTDGAKLDPRALFRIVGSDAQCVPTGAQPGEQARQVGGGGKQCRWVGEGIEPGVVENALDPRGAQIGPEPGP
jgi:hypothetical protein